MNNMISVVNDAGQKFQVEVLDIFNVVGYDNKEYVLYSLGESIDQENEKVYVSILENKGENYQLSEIVDSAEWQAVQNAINEDASGKLGDSNA